jgi:hypothetical protein
MDRGLKAPLSPHEESTLRRVALGISKAELLPARDVAHLIRLCLIDEKDGRLSLTALGRQRYQALPRPAARSDVAQPHRRLVGRREASPDATCEWRRSVQIDAPEAVRPAGRLLRRHRPSIPPFCVSELPLDVRVSQSSHGTVAWVVRLAFAAPPCVGGERSPPRQAPRWLVPPYTPTRSHFA